MNLQPTMISPLKLVGFFQLILNDEDIERIKAGQTMKVQRDVPDSGIEITLDVIYAGRKD